MVGLAGGDGCAGGVGVGPTLAPADVGGAVGAEVGAGGVVALAV